MTIGSVDVSGMTGAEAQAAVEEHINEMAASKLKIHVGEDYTREIAMSDLGFHWTNTNVAPPFISYWRLCRRKHLDNNHISILKRDMVNRHGRNRQNIPISPETGKVLQQFISHLESAKIAII